MQITRVSQKRLKELSNLTGKQCVLTFKKAKYRFFIGTLKEILTNSDIMVFQTNGHNHLVRIQIDDCSKIRLVSDLENDSLGQTTSHVMEFREVFEDDRYGWIGRGKRENPLIVFQNCLSDGILLLVDNGIDGYIHIEMDAKPIESGFLYPLPKASKKKRSDED